jgi:5'-nucleotidase
MTRRPRILITNDDGIHAPGIRYLWEALTEIADCTVVAPSREQSAQGMAVTIHHPLRFDRVVWPDDAPAYSVDGTPVDSVKLALGRIMESKPDLIVAGINNGTNAGRNLLYSGTVGTIIEGAIRGIPGIAVSCVDRVDPPYAEAQKHVPGLVRYILEHPLPAGTLLNANFPSRSAGELRGVRLAQQGKGYWTDDLVERTDHHERSYYWMGGSIVAQDEPADGDISLLEQGYAAVVPFQAAELTHHKELSSRREHFDGYFQ